jgi:hypothetical protein
VSSVPWVGSGTIRVGLRTTSISAWGGGGVTALTINVRLILPQGGLQVVVGIDDWWLGTPEGRGVAVCRRNSLMFSILHPCPSLSSE